MKTGKGSQDNPDGMEISMPDNIALAIFARFTGQQCQTMAEARAWMEANPEAAKRFLDALESGYRN